MLPQKKFVCCASGVKRRRSNYWGESDILRERLFSVIYIAFLENMDTLLECGMAHRNITPGKIVEKICHAYSMEEVYALLANGVMMGQVMYEMYEKVLEDETNAVKRIVF